MNYIEGIDYNITYLRRTGRNKSIYRCIGINQRVEEFPGYPMEKRGRDLQEYPT